jgi:membrane protease YdiL (CAAX protease family)
MVRFLLALGLLGLSAYAWPHMARTSVNSVPMFLLVLCLGLVALLSVICLFRRVNAWGQVDPSPIVCASLALRSVPVILLQVLFGIAYWASFIGAPQQLGRFAALPLYLLIPWIVLDSAIRGVVEEAVFRGMLQPALLKRYATYPEGPWIAVALTTFWFLVAHVYGVSYLRLLPYLGLVSLFYGYLVIQTRSVVSSAILHTGHNAGALLVASSGASVELARWLRSYVNGQTVILVIAVVLLLANAWAMHWFARHWVWWTNERSASTAPFAPSRHSPADTRPPHQP